jgi:hypothetical protein
LSRTVEEARRFSANLASFTIAGPLTTVWPIHQAGHTEDFLFPGVTALALVLVAGVAAAIRGRDAMARAFRTRSALLFYAGAALVMWWLAFGPAPEDAGLAVLGHPYTLLSMLPGFDGLRAPSRFAMLGVLCAAVAGGLAAARLAPAARGRRTVFAVVVLAGLVADGWMRDAARQPTAAPFPDIPSAVVAELPPGNPEVGVVDADRCSGVRCERLQQAPPPHTLHRVRAAPGSVGADLPAQQRPLIAIDERRDPTAI